MVQRAIAVASLPGDKGTFMVNKSAPRVWRACDRAFERLFTVVSAIKPTPPPVRNAGFVGRGTQAYEVREREASFSITAVYNFWRQPVQGVLVRRSKAGFSGTGRCSSGGVRRSRMQR